MRRDGGMHPRELKSTARQLAVVSGLTGQGQPPASEALSPLGTPLRCVHATPRCGAMGRVPVDVTHGGRADQPARLDKASTALESVKAGWPNGPALAAFRVALAQPPSWRGWVMALPAPWTLC